MNGTAATGFTVSGTHTFAEESGSVPVTVTINDHGASASVTSTAGVRDATLTSTGQTFTASLNAAFNGTVATFSDADPAGTVDDYTATIEWGDGGSSVGTVSQSQGTYTVAGTHTYTGAGDFTVRTTVSEGGLASVILSHAVIGAPHQQYVMSVYEDVLGRAPDPGGLAYWSNLLDSGTAISSVAAAIAHSDEYYANFVIKPDYLKLLGRAADDAGVQFWTVQMDAGATDQQLEADLVSSSEFYTNAGGTNTAWIDAVYKLLLGRTADANGENYWNSRLDAGETPSQVAQGIAGSQENNTQLINDDYLGSVIEVRSVPVWPMVVTLPAKSVIELSSPEV